MTTLTNSFHGTEYRTPKTRKEINQILNTHPDNRTPAQAAWVHRVAKALCGVDGCTCGRNELCER